MDRVYTSDPNWCSRFKSHSRCQKAPFDARLDFDLRHTQGPRLVYRQNNRWIQTTYQWALWYVVMEWYVKIHRGCWRDRGTEEEVHKIEIVLMTQQSFYSPSDSSPQPVVATATQSFSWVHIYPQNKFFIVRVKTTGEREESEPLIHHKIYF